MTHEPVRPGARVQHVQTLQRGTVSGAPDGNVESNPTTVTVEWDGSNDLPQVLPRHLVAAI